jgi:hypothetical protein
MLEECQMLHSNGTRLEPLQRCNELLRLFKCLADRIRHAELMLICAKSLAVKRRWKEIEGSQRTGKRIENAGQILSTATAAYQHACRC